MAALRVARPIGRAVCQIEGQLHAAAREIDQADDQAEQAERALAHSRRALAELEARVPQQGARPSAEPTVPSPREAGRAPAQAPEQPAGQHELLAQRAALAEQAEQLAEQSARAREQSARAEARRALLERQLALVERQQGTSTAPAAPPAGASTGAADDDGPPPKILLVDDRPENLVVLEALLGPHGHELVSATSGPDALRALIEPDGYAAILLDVQMPGMDGYETAAHIRRRARTRDIPIVFVTAIGSGADHAMRAYAAGAADFIPKPVDPWAVRAKVASFVELHRERAARR
nr:response regulator [Kitasatospora sp. SID7827]